MTKLLTLALTLLISTSPALSKQQQSKHLNTILSALAPELKSSKELKEFKSQGCELQKQKWVLMLITKQSFDEKLKFSKTCDIQGNFSPKASEFFPIDFKLRGLKDVSRLKALVQITVVFGKETKLKLELNKASYYNQKNILQKEFALTYSFEIDPFNPQNFLKKDLGGSLYLYKGKKLLKKIKLN